MEPITSPYSKKLGITAGGSLSVVEKESPTKGKPSAVLPIKRESGTQRKKRILSTPTVRGEILLNLHPHGEGKLFRFRCRRDSHFEAKRHLSYVTPNGESVMLKSRYNNEDECFIEVHDRHITIWQTPISNVYLEKNIPYKDITILWAIYDGISDARKDFDSIPEPLEEARMSITFIQSLRSALQRLIRSRLAGDYTIDITPQGESLIIILRFPETIKGYDVCSSALSLLKQRFVIARLLDCPISGIYRVCTLFCKQPKA